MGQDEAFVDVRAALEGMFLPFGIIVESGVRLLRKVRRRSDDVEGCHGARAQIAGESAGCEFLRGFCKRGEPV